LKSQ
jgi:hypothetical protein